MGERDDRIETLKARQEEMKDRLGGLDVEYRDLTNAPQGDNTPEQLDQRTEDIDALTGERTSLESELGRTEGELGELEAGEREDAPQREATETDLTFPSSDAGEMTAGPSSEGDASPQASTDFQNVNESVAQEPTQDVAEPAPVPREDWEKISAEQVMHNGQMTELRDAGNDIVANMNFASSEVGQEIYRDETGTGMTKETQRGLEQEAYSGGVEQLNSLFAAHDQQRQAMYGNNTAENPKVREAQMENRAAMDKEMNGLRYEIVQQEVCALEARKAVAFRNEDAIDHYRDRMTRDGQDAATIETRTDEYAKVLSQDAAKDVEKMTASLHNDHFSTVPQHMSLNEPAPATQQPGMARVAEEPNAPNDTEGGAGPETKIAQPKPAEGLDVQEFAENTSEGQQAVGEATEKLHEFQEHSELLHHLPEVPELPHVDVGGTSKYIGEAVAYGAVLGDQMRTVGVGNVVKAGVQGIADDATAAAEYVRGKVAEAGNSVAASPDHAERGNIEGEIALHNEHADQWTKLADDFTQNVQYQKTGDPRAEVDVHDTNDAIRNQFEDTVAKANSMFEEQNKAMAELQEHTAQDPALRAAQADVRETMAKEMAGIRDEATREICRPVAEVNVDERNARTLDDSAGLNQAHLERYGMRVANEPDGPAKLEKFASNLENSQNELKQELKAERPKAIENEITSLQGQHFPEIQAHAQALQGPSMAPQQAGPGGGGVGGGSAMAPAQAGPGGGGAGGGGPQLG